MAPPSVACPAAAPLGLGLAASGRPPPLLRRCLAAAPAALPRPEQHSGASSASSTRWPAQQRHQQQQQQRRQRGDQQRCCASSILTSSESARGLTNTELHLRQHYDEHINWDADKEESRVWRRTMFTFDDWKKHRSSYRYVHHLCTIFESRIVRGLARPVLVITACAIAVAGYHTLHAAQQLPALLPALPVISIEPFQLTSFALSLLLVFRTNSSHARWYEGRRRFGRITTTCRDVCRQMLAMVPRANVAVRALMARWLVAFCRSAKWYIREEEPLEEELQAWLEPHELQQLVASPHPPNFCMLVLSHAVANSGLQEHAVVRLEEGLSALSMSLSACDRILNTPIPLSYTRHTARFLILWLMLLPLALWGVCGWAMVPAIAVISFVLLGIEEIGVQIEEPFSILALENLCRKAERHISGLMVMDQGTYDLVAQATARPKAGGGDGGGAPGAFGGHGPGSLAAWQHVLNTSVTSGRVLRPNSPSQAGGGEGVLGRGGGNGAAVAPASVD